MAKAYGFTSLTGGGVGALDAIDGSILSVGDVAYGTDATNHYDMILDGSGAAESSPDCISPDSNAGTKRWRRRHDESKAYRATAPTNGHLASLDADGDVVDSGIIAANSIAISGTSPVYGDGLTYLGSVWNPVPQQNKNFLINGDFSIWQAGVSFTSLTTHQFFADMWKVLSTNDSTYSVVRDTTVPSIANGASYQPNYSALFSVATADAAIGAAQLSCFYTPIEGYVYRKIKDKTVTLSFWVRSNKTGIYCVSFRNSSLDRSYVVEYTISSVDTWEKKTVTLVLNSSGGTEDYTSGVGLYISWGLACGANFQVAANSWQNGNFTGTSNQVNFLDNNANTFRIAMAQLELGSYATPIERRLFGEELKLCQRYYEKSYDYAVALGTSIQTGAVLELGTIAGTQYTNIKYKVPKRINPTVVTYSTTGAADKIRNLSGAADTASTYTTNGENGTYVSFTAVATQVFAYQYTIDARM